MKTIKIPYLILISLLFCSCGKDDSDNNEINTDTFQDVFVRDCPDVTGLKAVYYNLGLGIPAPLNRVPIISNPGGRFVHSQFPFLGFTIPQGFQTIEITENQTGAIGVDLIRNDNNVVFRYIPNTQSFGQASPTVILANEINGIQSRFNLPPISSVRCSTTRSPNIEGIPTVFNARLIEFGNMTGLFVVNSVFIAGGTFSSISTVIAPTTEFEDQVLDTFLPINFELLLGPDGDIVDKDNDGFTVLEDPDDNDPNVPVNRG